MKETQDLDFNSFLVYDAPTIAGKNALSDMSLFKLADACRKYGERKSKARDAKLLDYIVRANVLSKQGFDAKHVRFWIGKALLLVSEEGLK